MYRPPPLLRYDLSARVHMEHLLDDLVGKNQVWSDAILNTGEKCVVLLEITGSNQLGLCVSLCNIVCWCMTTLIFLVTILSLGIYFCFRKCGNSFGRSKVQGKSNKCVELLNYFIHLYFVSLKAACYSGTSKINPSSLHPLSFSYLKLGCRSSRLSGESVLPSNTFKFLLGCPRHSEARWDDL